MNKNEIFKAVADKTPELKVKDIETVLAAYAEYIIETLKETTDKSALPLPGIGNFKVKEVAERKGKSALGDHKEWVKPAHREICFKISKSVRELG